MTRRLALLAAAAVLVAVGCTSTAHHEGPVGRPVGPYAPLPTPARLGAPGAIVGYGAATTGGTGGATCEVTTLDDAGPGSLRDCATRASTTVTFAPGLTGTLTLASEIDVANSVTIEGAGPAVAISNGGPGHRYDGLVLAAGNVILSHLLFADFGDWTKPTSSQPFPDPVWLSAGSNYVLDHLTITRDGGKIGIVCATDITMSWLHFSDSAKAIQTGDNAHPDCAAAVRLTIHHTWFEGVGYRSPRVHSSTVHLLNNLEDGWGQYAAASVCFGRLYSEGNVYRAATDTDAILTSGSSAKDDKCIDPATGKSANGYAISVGDVYTGGARARINRPDLVPAPTYPYTAEPAGDALVAEIMGMGAGA